MIRRMCWRPSGKPVYLQYPALPRLEPHSSRGPQVAADHYGYGVATTDAQAAYNYAENALRSAVGDLASTYMGKPTAGGRRSGGCRAVRNVQSQCVGRGARCLALNIQLDGELRAWGIVRWCFS